MYLCQASLGFKTLIHACQRKECLRNFFDLRTIQLLAELALDYVTRCAITSHAAVMPMTTLRKFRLAMLLLVLGCAVRCDQSSKHIARKELSRLGAVALPGGFGELWLAENPGVFLSLGVSLPQSLRLAVFTVGGRRGPRCPVCLSCWCRHSELAIIRWLRADSGGWREQPHRPNHSAGFGY
jgi:hypothetical protein